MDRGKKIVLALALVIFSVAVSLMVAEGVLRLVVSYSYEVRMLTYNPDRSVGFDKIRDWESLHESTLCSFEPGQEWWGFTANSHGFLTPEISYSKPKDVYRVLLLGDSQVVGLVPYEMNFFRLIESKLERELGEKFQFINLGKSCVGPGLYLKILGIEGVKYKPDLVIVAFFVGNDFTDEPNSLDLIRKRSIGKENESSPTLLDESRLVSFLKNSWIYFRSSSIANQIASRWFSKESFSGGEYTGRADDYDPLKPTWERKKYLEMELGRVGVIQSGSWSYDNLEQVKYRLLAIRDLVYSQDAELLVVIIPDEMQVNSQLLADVLEYGEGKIADLEIDLELPQRILSEFFIDNDIVYVNLLSYLRPNNSSGQIVYQPNDSHLNSIGHRIAANAIYPKLKVSLQNQPQYP